MGKSLNLSEPVFICKMGEGNLAQDRAQTPSKW